MRRSSVFAIACALAFAGAWAYTPVRHDGSYTTNGVTYAQRGGLGSADYVVTNIDADAVGRVKSVNGKDGVVTLDYSDVSALPDDQTLLEGNANFSNAVVAVSPPVELPQKWALGNVTNATGGAVSAVDVGAPTRAEVEAGWLADKITSIPNGATNVVFGWDEATPPAPIVAFDLNGKHYISYDYQISSDGLTITLECDAPDFVGEPTYTVTVVRYRVAGPVPTKPSDVGAIPASELVATEFSAASAYEEGDVVRHDGKAYRANTRKAAGLSWQSWMWDEVTNVQTAMEGALRNTYLKLGFAGTNTEEEVRITAGRYEDEIYPLSYFYLSPDSFGNRIGTTGRGWDFRDHGYIEWHGDGTYRRVWFTDIFTPDFVRDLAEPFTLATNATQFTTSPYYVHRYLTNNYYTASKVDEVVSGEVATATAPLVPNTRTVNGKPLSADVSLAASDVGAMAADARIDRLYNGGGSRYISGDGSVYSQNAEERWHVEFNGDTYDFTPHFGFAPNYWECSDFVGGQTAYLYYDTSEENWVLDIGPELWAEGTASDSYLDFQLGTAHFICTRYSTGTTFSYETRLAYTNDIPAMPDVDGATNALAQTIPNNITRSTVDATLVHCDGGNCTNALIHIQQATSSLAGLMTAQDKIDLGKKAPLDSPAFTGSPTAPTAADGDNSTKLATTAFVQAAIGSSSSNPLSGQSFDFATMQGVFDGIKACVEALGGSVTNFPANN